MQDKVNHSLCASSMSGNKMQGQQDPVMKTNPYPYAGNNPVNFVDPLWLDYDYVFWTHPYPDTLCKFSIDEDCGTMDCFHAHNDGDCSKKEFLSIGYTRKYHQRGIPFSPIGTCKECWRGRCYDACRHNLPEYMENDENSGMVECLNTAGCIPDENDPPPDDGNQPLGDGEKGPNKPVIKKNPDPPAVCRKKYLKKCKGCCKPLKGHRAYLTCIEMCYNNVYICEVDPQHGEEYECR